MGDPPDPYGSDKDGSPSNSRRLSSLQCTLEACHISTTDENKFQCNTCKRYIHFRCTNLPIYQIHQFQTKKYRNYVCISCTKVPDNLKNIIPTPPPPVMNKEADDLKQVIKSKEIELNSLSETNRILQEQIRKMTVQFEGLSAKFEKEENETKVLSRNASTMKYCLLVIVFNEVSSSFLLVFKTRN